MQILIQQRESHTIKKTLALVPSSRVYSMDVTGCSSISIKLRYSYTILIQDYNTTDGELSRIVEEIKKRSTYKSSTLHKISYQYEPYCSLDMDRSPLVDKVLANRHRQRMDNDLKSHHQFMLSHKKRSDDHHNFDIVQNAIEDEKDHQLTFRICSTYPASFLLPYHVARADYKEKLKEMIDFREKQRIPLISYIYTDPFGRHSSLWRSGQLKTGMLGRRQDVDEELISFIGSITFSEKNTHLKRCQIFDCRPYLNAVGNKIMGKGYLDPENYKINDVKFGNIANIHVMRKGLEDLLAGFGSGQGQAATRWVSHLQSILSGAAFVRDKLLEGISVLVNCSDGWDRTPQVVCLAKIMLEPYFRTLEGFRVLIHYEWNGFGHKFKSRQYFMDNGEASPVFIQFLDCVNQIRSQFPEKFEFNEKLLVVLAKAAIENCFIEFNFDNTEQYMDHDVSTQMAELSIWRLVYQSLGHFVNPSYEFKDAILRHKEECSSIPGLTGSGSKRAPSMTDEAGESQYQLNQFFIARKNRIVESNQSSTSSKDFTLLEQDVLVPSLTGTAFFIWNPVYNNFKPKYLTGRAHSLQLRPQ